MTVSKQPRDVYWQIVHGLIAGLPPPGTDEPEALAIGDQAAIVQARYRA